MIVCSFVRAFFFSFFALVFVFRFLFRNVEFFCLLACQVFCFVFAGILFLFSSQRRNRSFVHVVLFIAIRFCSACVLSCRAALAADDCTASFAGCRFEANTGLFDSGALRLDIDAVVDIDGSYFLNNRIDIETQGSTGGAGAGITAINSA